MPIITVLDAIGFPEAARHATATNKVELDSVIHRVTANWKRPNGNTGRVIVAERAVDLPAAILRTADAQKVPRNEIRAVFHEGHIYLVRENLKDGGDRGSPLPRSLRPLRCAPAGRWRHQEDERSI